MSEPWSSSSKTLVSKELDLGSVADVFSFLKNVQVSSSIPDNMSSKDYYSNIIGAHLKVYKIQPGRITCFFSVKPAVVNFYDGAHGGAVAAVAEKMAIACARTVVAADKEIFLGELSMSYLSGAPKHAELIVDGSVVRSGKNVTVVAVDFKFKQSGKLLFSCRATFFNSPISKL